MKPLKLRWTHAASFTAVIACIITAIVLAADINSPVMIASDVYPNRVNVGDDAVFSVLYYNRTGTDVTLYICKDSGCSNCGQLPDKSGCYCYNETPSQRETAFCTYRANASDNPGNYWVKLINITNDPDAVSDILIGSDAADFSVNHRPVAQSVYISSSNPSLPEGPKNQSTLYCNYTFYDEDSDSELTSNAGFKWFVQENGTGPYAPVPGEYEDYLESAHFSKSDRVKCTANVTDEHGFSSYPGTNSSSITIKNTGPVFLSGPNVVGVLSNESLNWSASVFDTDMDGIVVALVRWYKGGVLLPQYDNQNISPSDTSLGEKWKVELHLEDDDGLEGQSANSTEVTIGSPGPNIISIATTTEFENSTFIGHNVTFNASWSHQDYGSITASLIICNSTGATASGCPSGSRQFCKTGYGADSPTICSYTVQSTDRPRQQFYAVMCDNQSYCSSTYSGWFWRFNDSAKPNMSINIQSRNVSGARNASFKFNITDNYNISLETLYLMIENSTYSAYHASPDSAYFSKPWNFSSNITCSGNMSFQSCSVVANLSDGNYNLTFYVNDSNRNNYMAVLPLMVDSVVPSVLNLADGYIDPSDVVVISDIAVTNNVFANWSNISGSGSGIERFEYAFGTSEYYPGSGWDSVRGWTGAGLATQINFTAPLVPGTSYFFHVRAVNNGGAYSNVSSSDGIIYEDNTPPQCVMVFDYGPNNANWTNTLTELSAWWNFTEPDTSIVEYEYAIGNATPPADGFPPQLGFDNVRERTLTDLSEVTSSGLSLEEAETYYFSVRAKNYYQQYSTWCYSDGLTVDITDPYNGSIDYPESFLAYTNVTIYINPGQDDLSGIDQNSDVMLLVARELISQDTYTCPAFSSFQPAHLLPPYSPLGVQYNTTPGYCYKFRLSVMDRAGNEVIYHSIKELNDDKVFVTDNTPPANFQVWDAGHKTYDGTSLQTNWSFSSDTESGISYYSHSIWYKSKVDGSINLVYDWINASKGTNSMVRGGLQLEDETQYFIKIKAVNKVGLETTAMSNGIIYQDLNPPGALSLYSVENRSIINGYYVDDSGDGNTTINATGSDYDLSRCIFTQTDTGYYETGSNLCNVTGSGTAKNISCTISESEGAKRYYIYCRDINGNNQYNQQGSGIPLEVSWINDWSPPAITIVSPSSGQRVSGIVDLDANVQDSGIGTIGSVWYEIRNITGGLAKYGSLAYPGYNATWNTLTEGVSGIHILTVYANDTFGRTSNASANFTIDSGMPDVRIYSEQYVNDSISVEIIAQLFTNMSMGIYNYSGQLMHYNSSNSSAMRNYFVMLNSLSLSNYTEWPEGSYRIVALAVDNKSNSTNATKDFIIDRQPPVFASFTDTSLLSINIDTTLQLSAQISDDVPLDTVIISVNDSLQWTNYTWSNISQQNNLSESGGNFTLLYPVPDNMNSKVIYWKVYALDQAGNSNQSPVMNFSVENRPPYFSGSDQLLELYEDTLYINDMSLDFTDPEGDNITLSAVNGSNVFIIAISQASKTLTFSVSTDWVGQDNISINATDTFGDWNMTLFNVTVININDAPYFNASAPVHNITMAEDSFNQTISLVSHFYDIDNLTLSYGYEAPSLPQNVEVSISASGAVNVSSSGDYTGEFSLNFTASDGQYSNRSNQITINITPVNDAPVLSTVHPYTVNETITLYVVLNASDIDSSGLNFSLNDSRFYKHDDGFTFNWTPSITDSGLYAVNATVSDPEGAVSWQVFNVSVLDMEDIDGDGIPDAYDDDIDGDGILNSQDYLHGNSSHISTNIPGLRLTVGNSDNLSQYFAGNYLVRFMDGPTGNISHIFLAFYFNFSQSRTLDLTELYSYTATDEGPTVGMYMGGGGLDGANKHAFLHPLNFSVNSVCIKNNASYLMNITNISSGCNASDEQLVICDNQTYGGFHCLNYSDANGSAFWVSAVNHSVIMQMDGCTDKDGDSYGTGDQCTGKDGDDSDPYNYPGAPCSIECWEYSTYNEDGVCIGGNYLCGTSISSGGGGGGGRITVQEENETECIERWVCTKWSDCQPDGYQTRSCEDVNRCGTTRDIQPSKRLCEYTEPEIVTLPEPTCYDNAQNQGEEDVDCGGPCLACPTCFDGIRNQYESGVDCGGPCEPCEADLESPSSIDKGIMDYIGFLMMAFSIIAAVSVMSLVMHRKSLALEEKAREDFWIKEEAGHLLYYKRFDGKIFDKLVQLRIYIRKQLTKGISKEEIKEELVRMGWNESVVEESFMLNKYVLLELFIRNQLSRGVSKEKIKSNLQRIGWSEKTIEEIFTLNNLVQIELYIKKKFEEGLSAQQVRSLLEQAGWSSETIDRLIDLDLLLDLEIYINKQLSKGMKEADIREKLVNSGWSGDVVDEAILFCKLTR